MKSRVFSVTALVLLLFAVSLSAERWQSPDKFYSITVPFDWKRTESKSEAATSYAFTSPDGKSEIRISAAYDLDLPEVLPEDVLSTGFPQERGLSAMQRVRGAGWDGLRREYTNTSQSKRWLGIAARRGSTVVLLTMTAPSEEFEHFRSTFESVGKSLKLGE